MISSTILFLFFILWKSCTILVSFLFGIFDNLIFSFLGHLQNFPQTFSNVVFVSHNSQNGNKDENTHSQFMSHVVDDSLRELL